MNRSSPQVTFGRRRAPGVLPRHIEPAASVAPLPGLRSVPLPDPAPAQPDIAPATAAQQAEPAPHSAEALPTPPAARGEDWDRPRKRKRWLAEPYRTFSIVTGAGFGLSSWILPDSVQNITDLVTGGLTVLGLAAGVGKTLLSSAQNPASAQPPRD